MGNFRVSGNFDGVPSVLPDGALSVVRKTAAAFTSANPILAKDEFGLETDTGSMKIGDGTTAWTSLDYFNPATTGYALYFGRANGEHLNCGRFWDRDVEYGRFFYEAWIRAETGAEYVISDGYGGAHNLLFGFDGLSNGYGAITGNVYLNGATVGFTSLDGIYINEWHHIAIGWDGDYFYVFIDGVLSNKVAASGVRQTTGNTSEGNLFIGGSDHSNFKGWIRMVGGFEGYCPTTTTYRPDPAFNNSYELGGRNAMGRSFLMDLTCPSTIVPDLSDGFSNGTRQVMTNTVVAAAGITGNGNARNIVTAADLPNSPKTVTTAVTTALTTASLIAAAMRTSLRADSDIANFFIVGGTGADIKLTAIEPAANDSTFNLTIENVTSTGISDDTTATISVNGSPGWRVRHPGVLANQSDGGEYGAFPTLNVLGYRSPLPEWQSVNFAAPSTYQGTANAIPSTAVVYDDFSRPNVTWAWSAEALGMGTSRTGQVWTGSGPVGIIDGQAFSPTAGGGVVRHQVIDTGQSNQKITIGRGSSTDTEQVIYGRYTDTDNYVYVYLSSSQYPDVRQKLAGVDTRIVAGPAIGTSWTTLTLEITETTVNLYVDGVLSAGNSGNATTVLTGTKAGVGMGGQLTRIATFLVE